jgi:pyridoxine 5-phosphate synthase
MNQTRLSVNINKIATLRNARGGSVPDVVLAAVKCQEFGAQGITVHPRPDERHIRYQDVRDLRHVITSEFNIEGYPSRLFIDLVLEVRPHQVTLVPDSHDVITSNQGWNVIKYEAFLKSVIQDFQQAGIRTSLFIETDLTQIACAADTGTNRIELYTEPYAQNYLVDHEKAVAAYVKAAQKAAEAGLEVICAFSASMFRG